MSFFALSKILGFFLNPLNAIFVLFLFVTIFLLMGKYIAARRLSLFISAIFIALIFLPIGGWLLYPLEQRFPEPKPYPQKVDGIIVLGGAQQPLLTKYYGQPALNSHAERMTTFISLARHYPNAKLVFSGGSGDILNQNISEVDTVKLLLKEQAFNDNRVMYESKSRNTYENVLLSKQLVAPKKDEVWLMINSAASVPRAIGIFQKLDWPIIAIPCDYQTLPPRYTPSLDLISQMDMINYAMHEWIGLIVYYLTDKSSSLFPK